MIIGDGAGGADGAGEDDSARHADGSAAASPEVTQPVAFPAGARSAGVDCAALREVAYRLAEALGVEAEVTLLVSRAARTGDPDLAARAWDAIVALPKPLREALARGIAADGYGKPAAPATVISLSARKRPKT